SRYFVTFFDDIHQGNAVFGYLGTVQSGMEFVMYMVIPLFVNFIGAKRGLLIVGLVVGARLIISGMSDSHLLISVLKPLY
ncbi:MFS transporter, partial [Klebsiella pneumoniae]|uniref:MFS transporter n=2 Tax=Enterobacteriaceae TaxID=543 RepID=UPI001967C803